MQPNSPIVAQPASSTLALSQNRVLVVYYFNIGDGPRFIAGTVLALD